MRTYFVVIPVFNEQRNIRRCITNIKKYWKHIIVVNDGSTDATASILNRFRSIHTIHLSSNQGKGSAMLIGAMYAWKKGARGIIFMDGDNQHNPVHIKAFVRLLDQKVHIIIGVRLLKTNIPIHRKIGNRLIAFAMRHMFSLSIPDIMCGFRALSKKGFQQLRWSSNGYGVETEMLTTIGKKNIPFRTLVVDTIYHDKYKGFSLKDGIKILLHLPYWKWKTI